MRVPVSSLLRRLSVLLWLVVWFGSAHRCALAGWVAPAPQAVAVLHRCCAGEAPAGKPAAPATSTDECCQEGQAAPATQLPTLAPAPDTTTLFDAFWVLPALAFASEARISARPGHAPPGASAFVEIVLQRSLQSHAPPVRA